MSRKILLIVCLLSTLITTHTLAQQNLFNIPSGDITPQNKIFFQQQININSISKYAAKSHFVYGLCKGSFR
jgi:hypothetical protein